MMTVTPQCSSSHARNPVLTAGHSIPSYASVSETAYCSAPAQREDLLTFDPHFVRFHGAQAGSERAWPVRM